MFFFAENFNRDNVCRGECCSNKFGRIFAVTDDIKLFTAELVNNLVDSCASLTDAGTYGVNVFVGTVNGNLAS